MGTPGNPSAWPGPEQARPSLPQPSGPVYPPPPGPVYSPPPGPVYSPPGAAAPPGGNAQPGGYRQPGQNYGPPAGQPWAPPSSPAYPVPDSGPFAGPGVPPGQPPAPGYPASPPAGRPPLSARVKRNRIIALVVVVVLVGAGLFFYLQSRKTDAANSKIGDCVQEKADSTTTDPDMQRIDCSDPNAVYVVSATGSSQSDCDDSEADFYQTLNGSPTNAVCLRPNLEVGDCWTGADADPPAKVACSAATSGDEKLVALLTTSSNDSDCPDATTKYISLPKRTMVYCFGPVS